MQDLAVSEVRTGHADFDAVIGPHLVAGYRTALAILRDPNEAHDAVQESALKAWRNLGQLKTHSAARPWFLAIVANQCRSMLRTPWWSVIRLPRVEREEQLASIDMDIERALARLPRDDRLALFLHFYLDMPLDQVGTVLGLTEAGAKTRVYRAAKKLRPGLEIKE